mmetsp:Transcript_24065/g.57310  ORF Transcript_24065/g.57310 Transcript_24065/m.57310 type:complete len:213 (+) Transcript_24065:177-815(+)
MCRVTYFYHGHSPFSNFHPATFSMDVTGPGGKRNKYSYTCSEQAMMHCKALLFSDFNTASRILEQNDPLKCKRLGRQVKNFVESTWDDRKLGIMFGILANKFCQNPGLNAQLLNTGDSILAEASPRDKVWGIGMEEREASKVSPVDWPGQNLLGKLLVNLREEISEEGPFTCELDLGSPDMLNIEYCRPKKVPARCPSEKSPFAASSQSTSS